MNEDDIQRKRVMFFSARDLSCKHFLADVERILNDIHSPETINDGLELYHVKKFVDSRVFQSSWKNNSDDYYEKIVRQVPKLIGCYFAMNKKAMMSLYEDIDTPFYKETFWEIMVDFKFFSRWDETILIPLYDLTELIILLRYKDLVKNYGSYLRDRISRDSEAAELIIKKYVFIESFETPFYLPRELTVDDISLILMKYISSQKPHLNFLKGIMLLQDNLLTKPAKIKFLAKKRSDEIEDDFFSDQKNFFSHGIGVRYKESLSSVCLINQEGDVDVYTYDLTWIIENSDYRTLLNNFIYLFQFVDDIQFRCSLINNRNQLGVFERVATGLFKDSYNPGSIFHYKLGLARLQIGSYYELLKKLLGLRLEDVITSFFIDYLPEEFAIENYFISLPSEGLTYFEKCKVIAPELDKVLKELDCLESEGYIEHGMIEISSSSKPLAVIPSLVKMKYFIGTGPDFNKASYLLCSDQCMLHYLERFEKRGYNRFYTLVNENDVNVNEYHEIYEQDLIWLQEHDFITVDETGKISLTKRSTIMVDLFNNQVISFWHYPIGHRGIILELENAGYLSREDIFFSKPESDFFNYILNNSTFVDSLAIRNRYLHGASSGESSDDRIHEENYYLFLILLILIIIKINDELCIRDSQEYINGVNQGEDDV